MALTKEDRIMIRSVLRKGSINEISELANVSRVSVGNFFNMKTKESDIIEDAILVVYERDKIMRENRIKELKRKLNE